VGLRIGFRVMPHVYFSVPLFRSHARRIAHHTGHAGPGVLDQVLGFLFLCWLVGKCVGPDTG
jgi:hypothetical protein